MHGTPPRYRFVPPERADPPPPPGAEPVVWFEVAGGLRVGLRPIHPDDREALAEGFAGLSEGSRYHRFLTPMSRLSDRHSRYLTEIDQVDHFAWGAGTCDQDGEFRGIGVARYVRQRDDPAAAEIAVAVADGYHGLGVGRLLVRALAVVAGSHGVGRLTGLLLGDNRPMVRIFEGLGGRFATAGPGLLRAEADLEHGTLCDLGDRACSELIRVADRAAHPSAQHRDEPRR